MPAVAAPNRNLVLAAMIFAAAITFIDQTIVSIAVPNIERELSLSATGVAVAFVALRRGLQEASPEEASALSG